MRDDLAARLLAQVLGWDGAAFADTGSRLQALARYKYDEYEGYRAGERFLENLAGWLAQFDPAERPAALRFILDRLVFISRGELDHLIETVYPDLIRPALIRRVAATTGSPAYRVLEITRSVEFRDLERKTLILGLADGARLDRLRRASPELSHEQFYPHPDVGADSSRAMRDQLAAAIKELGLAEPARFRQVFLVDDFAGSGYTLLHREPGGIWLGKLSRAAAWIQGLVAEDIVAPDAAVWVLLYIATEQATEALGAHLGEAGLDWQVLVVQPLRRALAVEDPVVLGLCERYFDPMILDRHLLKGATPPHLGFGGAALPLVLHHNTPNNSLSLLWADTTDRPDSLGRRALFPRRQRHNPDRP
jgi:hypothetical protein